MKKSKLIGALAAGGGLKYAIVPYIITGEENNGYSKGDILDANYVKQLINNATPNDISADTLTLHSGMISTDNGFRVFDKALNIGLISCYGGTTIFKDWSNNDYITANGSYFLLRSSEIHIGNNSNLFASFNEAHIMIGGECIDLSKDVLQFPTGVIRFDRSKRSISIGNFSGFPSISIGDGDIIMSTSGVRMGDHVGPMILYYSKDDSGLYKHTDTAIEWDDSRLRMDKIYKTTQNSSIDKDLFERVSDLEAPKITREDDPKVGQCVFDTTLGKPIWCKTAKTDTTAAVWVDATGAIV